MVKRADVAKPRQRSPPKNRNNINGQSKRRGNFWPVRAGGAEWVEIVRPAGVEPTAKPAEIMQVTAKSGAKSGAVSNSLPNSRPNHQINSQSRRPHPKDRLDAGLQSLIDAWPQLPDPVRAAILTLSGIRNADLQTQPIAEKEDGR
jgi:hypothetical protein